MTTTLQQQAPQAQTSQQSDASSEDAAQATRNAWLFGVSLAVGVSAMGGAAAAVYFSRKSDDPEKKGKEGKGQLAPSTSMTSIAVEPLGGVDNGPRGAAQGGHGQEHTSRIYQPPSLEVV